MEGEEMNAQFMRVDSTGIDRSLAILSQFTKKPIPEIIRDSSMMMARYLASGTPPFVTLPGPLLPGKTVQMVDGDGKAARLCGRDAVARDIRRVYMQPRKVYESLRTSAAGKALATAFWKAAKRGDVAEVKAILHRSGISAKGLEVTLWDGGDSHRLKRTPLGRINRGTRPTIVLNPKALKAYAKQIQDRVGYTKSGWINAAAQVSTRGAGQVAGWIRGKAGPGEGRDDTQGTLYPSVTLSNAVPWINRTISASFLSSAVQAFETNLAKQIQIESDYWIKKSGMEPTI